MPRLIDADALIKYLRQAEYNASEYEKYDQEDNIDREMFYSTQSFIDVMECQAPTVDAVAVVRCRDCQHWDFEDCECGSVYGLPSPCEADDFCSYGTRKEAADGRSD